jgi:hypothetical protein
VRAAPVPPGAPGGSPDVLAVSGVVALVAAGLVLLVGVVAIAAPREGREHEGWAGAGTAVFLALAGGIGTLFSVAGVSAVASWLRTSEAPENASVLSGATARALRSASAADRLRDAVVVPEPRERISSALTSPALFDAFAVTGVLAVVAFSMFVVVVALKNLRKGPGDSTKLPTEREPLPSAPDPSEDRDLSKAEYDKLSPEEQEAFASTHKDTYARQQRRRVRRRAALAHRAEPLVGVLALFLWGAVMAAFVTVPAGDDGQGTPAVTRATVSLLPVWQPLQHFAPLLVVAAAAAVVGAIGAGGANGKEGRPWGLLWDLTCFLPRVAHPYAAPCYAERAVPELRGRIDEWLGVDVHHKTREALAERAPTVDHGRWKQDVERRRVVVSAHSMGAVVSVAAIMARVQFTPYPDDQTETYRATIDRPGTIALLTYGSQLRAYFGRFFPELFGPDVLGTRPARRAHLWRNDPWAQDRQMDSRPPRDGVMTLVDILRNADTRSAVELTPRSGVEGIVRWRNLWRATDYLGFPVDTYDYGSNGPAVPTIDYGESEVDQTTYLLKIATHGGDYSTKEYRDHLLCLIHSLDDDDATVCSVPGCPRSEE